MAMTLSFVVRLGGMTVVVVVVFVVVMVIVVVVAVVVVTVLMHRTVELPSHAGICEELLHPSYVLHSEQPGKGSGHAESAPYE